MQRILNGMMERVARTVPRLNMLLGLAGVLVGSAILVTCTTAGLRQKNSGKITAFLSGLGGFLVVIVLTVFFVGSIYLLVRTSEDVRAIRQRMESRPPESQELHRD